MSVKISKDKIPGGLADKVKGKKFDPRQLAKGIRVEMEHTNDKSLAREIAKDHLMEDPKYYDHLIEMEREVSKAKKANRFADIFLKCAQVPNVRIQPGRKETSVALEILQMFASDTGQQNYFTDPNDPSRPIDIVIGPSANYGHVETGVNPDPDQDEQPTTVYINADRIVSEAGGQQSGKAAAIASAKVIAHEIGHLRSYQKGKGFQGGETPAQAQEQNFDNWLNSSGMQKIETLASYQSLPG
jgi:hypothetical protein